MGHILPRAAFPLTGWNEIPLHHDHHSHHHFDGFTPALTVSIAIHCAAVLILVWWPQDTGLRFVKR